MASPPPRFFMYSGSAFPPPEALLACPALRRMAPLAEPMAQFYSELGVHRLLRSHPARTADPAVAELFYVPWCPHLDQDAGRCNKTNHRGRAEGVAAALRASPWWRRHNGSDHVYVCACVMMRSMLSSLWTELGRAIHLRHHAAQQGDAERVHRRDPVLQRRLCVVGRRRRLPRARARAADPRPLPRPRDERRALGARQAVRRARAPPHPRRARRDRGALQFEQVLGEGARRAQFLGDAPL
jgi:hypothetical protein